MSNEISRLTLHHFPATRSVRARWALLETVGEGFQLRRVELYDREQYGAEFLALNPNHNVPVLEIEWADGTHQTMLESAAMVEWLADRFPEKGLVPPVSDGRARADYLQMLHFGGTWMDMMLWQVRVHEHILSDDEKDERTIRRYREKFTAEAEPQLLARLDRHEYICGDSFTAADIVVGHSVFWAQGYGMCQDERFTAYRGRLMQREGAQKALDDLHTFQIAPNRDSGLEQEFSG